MSITTYAELQSAITNWLGGRSDIAAARITECIALFEASANRRLRTRKQETTTTLTPSSGSATLPTDYLEARRVTWTGSVRVELQYAEPSYLQAAWSSTPSGTPVVYTIEGSTLKVRPTSTTDLEFAYYAMIAALSDSATTNWLLTAHPDLYLFGSLAELETLLENDTRVQMWIQRRDAIFDEIEKLSNRSRYGSGAGVRVMAETP